MEKDFKFIEGGVACPEGFLASGVLNKIKPSRTTFDTALVFSEKQCNAAGIFTKNKVKAECVITDEGNSILEIKNIAVAPEEQKQGLGRKLIEFVKDKFKQEYKILQVGTGDSPLTIPFYESCGFKRSHVISGFFTKNYDHPIYEAGVLLKDMVILRMDF